MIKQSWMICAVLVSSVSSAVAIEIENIPYRPGDRFDLTLATDFRYNDNYLYLDENEQSSWLVEFMPSLDFQYDQESYAIATKLKSSLGAYEDDSNDNFADVEAGLVYQFKYSDRQRLKLAADWRRMHESRGTGLSDGAAQSINKPDVKVLADLSLGYEYGSVSGKTLINTHAGFGEREYQTRKADTRDFNYKFKFVRASIDYKYSGKTYVAMLSEFSKIDYDHSADRDSDEFMIFTGMLWRGTGLITGRALLGYYHKKLEQSYNGSSWDLAVDYKPLTYSVVSLSSGRSLEESYISNAEFIRNDHIRLDWRHNWRTDVHTKMILGYQRERFILDTTNQDKNTTTAKLEWHYDYKKYLRTSVTFGYEGVDSDWDASDYDQMIYGVGIEFDL